MSICSYGRRPLRFSACVSLFCVSIVCGQDLPKDYIRLGGRVIAIEGPEQVLPVQSSSAPASYPAPLQLTLTTATSGATIYYTTDGSAPTTSSDSGLSGSSQASVTLVAVGAHTVRAFAARTGMIRSGASSFEYTVTSGGGGQVLAVQSGPVPGPYPGPLGVTLTTATPGATIHYTLDLSQPTTTSPSGPAGTSQATLTLQSLSTTQTIWAIAVKAGMTPSNPVSFDYVVSSGNQVAQVQSSSVSGTYSAPLVLTLSTSTSGATVYYTTNGSDPTTSSASGAAGSSQASLTLSSPGSVTVKAIAAKAGFTTSIQASYTYTITSIPSLMISPPYTTLILTGPAQSQQFSTSSLISGETAPQWTVTHSTGAPFQSSPTDGTWNPANATYTSPTLSALNGGKALLIRATTNLRQATAELYVQPYNYLTGFDGGYATGPGSSTSTGTTLHEVLRFFDQDGYLDIGGISAMISGVQFPSPTASEANTCSVYANVSTNTLYLKNDAGNDWAQAGQLGSPNDLPLVNSQCTISLVNSSLQPTSATYLDFHLDVNPFSPSFGGQRYISTRAIHQHNGNQWYGGYGWFVPGSSDVSITKSHLGNFTQGQTGATYTLTVSNLGSAPTSGTVTVTDTLPSSLTATAISGTGWSCTLATRTCTRTDALGAGLNYPPITLTVTVAANAPSSVTNSATVSGGGETNSMNNSASDPTTIAPSNGGSGPVSLSASPSAGSGLTQTFAFAVDDPQGANDISWVHVHTGLYPGNGLQSCSVYYSRAANTVYLVRDDGTAWQGSAVLNTAGTLANTQCSINVGTSSRTLVGNRLTLNLAVTFTSYYAGTFNWYVNASDGVTETGWIDRGDWTVAGNVTPGTPTVSFVPGSGSNTEFRFTYSDGNGYQNIREVYTKLSATSAASANVCWTTYKLASNSVWLLNDAGNAWLGPKVLGVPGTLENSQCTIDSGMGRRLLESGPNFYLNIPYTIKPGFTGQKNIYQWVSPVAAPDTAAVETGAWTYSTNQKPANGSISPSAGSGSSQTFTFVASDPNGHANISTFWMWMHSNGLWDPGPSCFFYYDRPSNTLQFLNEGGTAYLSVAPGSATIVENNNCAVTGVGLTASGAGNNLTVTVPVTFKAAFAGAKNIALAVIDNTNAFAEWRDLGTWTVEPPAGPASLMPNSGTGLSQTFTFAVDDPDGANDISWVQMQTAQFVWGGLQSCNIYYSRSANTVYLARDDGTQWQGSAVLGTAGTLSNSQCNLNVGTSTRTLVGNRLTLNLVVTFASSYAGSYNWYVKSSDATTQTGWIDMGDWTVPGNVAPGTPAAFPLGSGSNTELRLSYSDGNGYQNIRAIGINIAASTSQTNACVVAYTRADNALYLLNDAGTAWLGPNTVGVAGTLQNTQCIIDSGISRKILESGSDFYFSLALSLKAGYTGTKNIYQWVSPIGAADTTAVNAGTWTYSSNQKPANVSVSPSSGSGGTQTFTFVASDPNGYANISTFWMSIRANNVFGPAPRCFFVLNRALNLLQVFNEDESVYLDVAPGSAAVAENSRCKITGTGLTVSGSGNSLTVTVPVIFKAAFAGSKNVEIAVIDNSNAFAEWKALGTWTAQ